MDKNEPTISHDEWLAALEEVNSVAPEGKTKADLEKIWGVSKHRVKSLLEKLVALGRAESLGVHRTAEGATAEFFRLIDKK